MSHPDIHIAHADNITTITIDRQRRKNACTAEMFTALRDAFRDIADAPTRVVVLTGAGGDFCAGADVGPAEEDPSVPAQPQRHRVDHMRDIADTVMAIHDCPRPVIAKVDGVAVGAGFGIALAADLIWCSSRARFSLIFAKRGLSLDFGTSWLLPKRIGLHEAKRLALTGEIINADRAVELGIVNAAVDAAELDTEVADMAARIAAGPPIALASTKRLLNNASSISLFQALEAEGLSQALNFSTADTNEALAAFVEKRDPVFKGA